MVYLKIKLIVRTSEEENFFKKGIRFLIGLIVPKANPQNEKKMRLVAFWVLEFESEKSIPIKEIGLDSNEKTIIKMPYTNNYGYWIDNNLTYVDFENIFETVQVTKEYFEQKWKEFP